MTSSSASLVLPLAALPAPSSPQKENLQKRNPRKVLRRPPSASRHDEGRGPAWTLGLLRRNTRPMMRPIRRGSYIPISCPTPLAILSVKRTSVKPTSANGSLDMRVLFDTSVLDDAVVAGCPHHREAVFLIDEVENGRVSVVLAFLSLGTIWYLGIEHYETDPRPLIEDLS